jgi:hypothetical protein
MRIEDILFYIFGPEKIIFLLLVFQMNLKQNNWDLRPVYW